MTQELLEGFTFETNGVNVRSNTNEDGETVFQKITFNTGDTESGKVTFRPKVNPTIIENGIEMESAQAEPMPVTEAPADLVKLIQRLQDGETLEITATVTEWNQANEDDVDGDDTHYFIRAGHAETIKADM